MTSESPLRAMQLDAGAQFTPFGPDGCELALSFGEYEAEYAAIRKGVGILHEPQRGVLQITGNDRQDYLHRMLTQDMNARRGGDTRRAFQLNEKGRIVADLTVHHGGLCTWLEADACDLPTLAKLLDDRLFGEDVKIEDITAQRVAISLHGPATLALVKAVADDDPTRMFDMPGTHHVIMLAGDAVSAYRCDLCGAAGVRLWPEAGHAAALYAALAGAVGGLSPDVDADAAGGGAKRAIKGRGVGWLAFNTARIEAGTPLFHVDFGPDSLPHELGVAALHAAVSFTKGCYLGQEIVARMHNLGHPKRVLAGLRFKDDRLPIAGSPVFDEGRGDTIGAVTSSAVSPMLGGAAVALAMMKWGRHAPGTAVSAPAEGAVVAGAVQALPFI